MKQTTMQQRLKEINNSTLHNLRFLLESYSTEVLEVLDTLITKQSHAREETCETIRKDVFTVMKTLQGVETVINHYAHIITKEAS